MASIISRDGIEGIFSEKRSIIAEFTWVDAETQTLHDELPDLLTDTRGCVVTHAAHFD